MHQSFNAPTTTIPNNTWENIEEKESYQSSIIFLKKTGQEHSYVTAARLSSTLQTQMIDGTVSMYLNNKKYINKNMNVWLLMNAVTAGTLNNRRKNTEKWYL